jgi:hypothetical protein
MSVDLSKLTADVAAQTSVIASVQTAFKGLADQIAALKNVAPAADAATQKAIDDLAASVEANSASLSAAVAANTPAASAS